jgi:hypothetical protein
MTLFNGDNKDTKIIGTVNGKNFYWKIDTGSAVTCMNINAFETAFGKTKEKNLKEFKTDIFIRKRRCAHTVQIADESSENILGIDFLQKFRLHLDPITKEVTFQSAPSRALFATKNFSIPPSATTLVQARTFQTIDNKLHYIADIGVPKQPLISGLSTLVSFDLRNQCTMPIQNCAPHEVNINTGNILGILSTQKDEPIPSTMTASLPFVNKSTNDYQRSRREHGPGKKSKRDVTSELRSSIAAGILTYWSSIKRPLAWTNMIWDTESTSRIISPFFGNNSTYQKRTPNSLNRAWMNGSN